MRDMNAMQLLGCGAGFKRGVVGMSDKKNCLGLLRVELHAGTYVSHSFLYLGVCAFQGKLLLVRHLVEHRCEKNKMRSP